MRHVAERRRVPRVERLERGFGLGERLRHRLEAHHARARAERVELAAKLVARPWRARIALERGEALARVAHLATERRDEVGARPTQPLRVFRRAFLLGSLRHELFANTKRSACVASFRGLGAGAPITIRGARKATSIASSRSTRRATRTSGPQPNVGSISSENAFGKLADLRVAEQGGHVVGHGLGFALKAWFGGRPVQTVGIASVGVAPEARGMGVGSAIVSGIERHGQAGGAVLSMLHAYRHAFYAKRGYAEVTPKKRLESARSRFLRVG